MKSYSWGVDKKHRRRRPCPCRSPALPGSVSFLLPLCKVPYRGTTLVVFAYRSDNHAAVLRLQNTQPKDRRAYTPLTGILAVQQGKGGGNRAAPKGGRDTDGGAYVFYLNLTITEEYGIAFWRVRGMYRRPEGRRYMPAEMLVRKVTPATEGGYA